jgi:hypothetical protein
MRGMAYAGNCSREGFGTMDSGGRHGGRDPKADEQCAGDLPERHAERAVDQLRRESDDDEDQEDRRIVQDGWDNRRMLPLLSGRRRMKAGDRTSLPSGNSAKPTLD